MKKKVIKKDNDFVKIYGLLFCLSFIDFLLLGFYILVSIITISNPSTISAIMLLLTMCCSIYFIIKWQYENNKIIDLKTNKKKTKKEYKKVSNNESKIFKINNKKNYHAKLKEQL